MRFEKRDDCYFDTETGLEWAIDYLGPYTWEDAMGICVMLSGWRLPTIQELLHLVDYAKFDPATGLPGMKPSFYWSSSNHAYYTDCAWAVSFDDGGVDHYAKAHHIYVRCVRGGP